MNAEPPSPKRKSWWSWIKISEVVGVLALVIAALGFWDTHTERKLSDRERQAAEQREIAAPAFVLIGSASDDGTRIVLRPAHEDQVVQNQTFVFPTQVRTDPVETTGDARIEVGWVEQGLRRLGGGKATPGDLRLPVGVSTSYLVDGDVKADQSIYDIGYRREPRFLRPDRVVLEGLSVARRGVSGDLKTAVEQVFKARQPQEATNP